MMMTIMQCSDMVAHKVGLGSSSAALLSCNSHESLQIIIIIQQIQKITSHE